jgi:hypothetical protein
MAEEANVIQLDADEVRNKQSFWSTELEASQKLLEKWHKRGTKIVQRYLDERRDENTEFKLNLFHSNVKTMQDMLYSSLPKVEASRTHSDSSDDVARVAAETIERMINLDIAENGEEYDSVLRSVLQDRLLPGLGCARVRYEVETEEVEIPEQVSEMGFVIAPASTETVVKWEDAPVEYYHWQDVLWGWGRSFAELPWIAFRVYLSKSEVEERFGEKAVKDLTYRKQKAADTGQEFTSEEDNAPWAKAEIWEIWDKVSKKVFWYGVGATRLLDVKEDPLELQGFFPCPPFLIANATTALYRPTPDYYLAQDLYNEIDGLQDRIATITEAVKVVGVYDAASDGIQRMLTEGVENDLIPVDSWAMFAESGGLKGKIDWLPVLDVVNSLDKLRQLRDETIALLQQQTGMSDIMQGALRSPYEGVGQSQMKAQFGSVRVQALQDQFAQFAADLLQLKAEIICKHFEPQTIIEQSNMQYSMDGELLPQAVELLKQPKMAYIRIKVRPETVAMVDYARLKVERTEFLTAMATFMQSAAPMVQQDRNTMPYLIKMLQWSMAGFKGSQEIEGILDKAVEDSIQRLKQQQEEPDPEQQKEQAKLQGEMQKIQAKAQADIQLRQTDLQADIQTAMAQHQAKMAEIQATHESRISEIQQKLQADLFKDQMTLQGDLEQIERTAAAEVEKDNASTQLDIVGKATQAEIELDKEAEKTRMKMQEIAAASAAKIAEMMEQGNERPDSD